MLAAGLILFLGTGCAEKASEAQCVEVCKHTLTTGSAEGATKAFAEQNLEGDALAEAKVEVESVIAAELAKAIKGEGELAKSLGACSETCKTSPPTKKAADCALAASTMADIQACVD